MKTILPVCLTLCLLLSLAGCGAADDRVYFEETAAYVNAHVQQLASFPYDGMTAYDDAAYIRDHLGRDTMVKSVYMPEQNKNILKFYCGGSGNAANAIYTGFYYTKDDMPYAMEFDGECTFTQTEPGVYEWQNADETHRFRTQRIRPNWFYYYMVWY